MGDREIPHGNSPILVWDYVTLSLDVPDMVSLLVEPGEVGIVRHLSPSGVATVVWAPKPGGMSHWSMIHRDMLLGVYRGQADLD